MTVYHGIKISKSGYSILTAAIANQIFNSEKNCVKIAYAGTVSSTLSAGGGSATHNVEHGFSFAPAFLVWFELDNSGEWLFMYTANSDNDYVNCNPYSNTTYVVIPLINSGDSQHAVVAHYVIFADRGA